MPAEHRSLFDRRIVAKAAAASLGKLDPRGMAKNPVMFVTEVGALVTTVGLFLQAPGQSMGFGIQVTVWLWFTVLFANFAEAMAEGRGRAQADALRKSRTRTVANRLLANGAIEQVPAEALRKGDIFLVSVG
jgi:potassium-transporting ATPase ATP-binding subunit